MAIRELTTNLNNVTGLADQPIQEASELKAIFDMAGNQIKTYINTILIPDIMSNLLSITGGTITQNLTVNGNLINNASTTLKQLIVNQFATFGGGVAINATGTSNSLELYGSTPFLDFHFNNSSSDYTSRIIEREQGKLSIDAPNGTNITKAIEVWSSNTPVIDFHYGNHTGDYSTRIIEDTFKHLKIIADNGINLAINPNLLSFGSGNYTSSDYWFVRNAHNGHYIVNTWQNSGKLELSINNQSQGYFILTSSSDRRLKTDIKEIDENVIKAIGEVKLKQFKITRNNPQNKISFGIIAQELIETFEKYGLNYKDYNLIDTIIYEDEIEYFIVNYDQFQILRMAYLEKKLGG